MPILKIKNESYRGEDMVENVVNYVCRSGCVGGVGLDLDPLNAIQQMDLAKQLWHKSDPNKRQIRHFIVSFADNEYVDIEGAMQYGCKICEYYGDRFQTIFGLHMDTDNMHLHFAMNTVSYVDGKMFSEGYPDYARFQNYIQSLMPRWEVTLVADDKSVSESNNRHYW